MALEDFNDIEGHTTHREMVGRYFSSKTDFWTVVYSQEGGACNNYMGFHMRRRRDTVLKCLSEFKADKADVLDVGCGSGALITEIKILGHEVSGVDISPEMVAKAKEQIAKVRGNPENIGIGGAEDIPYESKHFDVVTCVGVVEYVYDHSQVLSELKRVLKDDGRIILTFPNMFKLQNCLDPYYWFVRGVKYIFRNTGKTKAGLKAEETPTQISTNSNFSNKRYSCWQLEKTLKEAGLVAVDWVSLGYGPFTLFKKKVFSEERSLKISDLLEKTFQRRTPKTGRCFANRWVICLKKEDTYPLR